MLGIVLDKRYRSGLFPAVNISTPVSVILQRSTSVTVREGSLRMILTVRYPQTVHSVFHPLLLQSNCLANAVRPSWNPS